MCCSSAWGCLTTSRADMASIWHAVFHFPNEFTCGKVRGGWAGFAGQS